MALSKLTSADAGAASRAKINAAIDALNLLDGAEGRIDNAEANITNLLQDLAALGADAQQADAILFAAAGKAEADIAELKKGLSGLLDGALALISRLGYPGYAPFAFSSSTTGSGAQNAPFDQGAVQGLGTERALLIKGAAVVAPRLPLTIDPDNISILRVRYWRKQDVEDPNNAAVDVGIQWLDATDGDAGLLLLDREVNLRVQDGPKALTWRVPSEAGAAAEIIPPKRAVAWRPYLRTYSAEGETALGLMEVRDATFAGVYAPDVYALMNRVCTIDAQIAAGLPFATPILPSYPVADLPAPGNRGRKAFAQDGRAPSAAGTLEPANAGSGVEVTDNGTAWVITGTNQQVQA